ncbi:MAG: S8 family peptidase [Bacteroidales bacterium]|jgi:hypothetical protein|nr:S8 family peptidase [Bacteroidales bacterium]
MKPQRLFVIFFLLFLLFSTGSAQQEPDCFRIYLSDKVGTPYTTENPNAFLSERAVSKRIRFQISITEQDLPVNPTYVDSIQAVSSEIRVIAVSKWLNTVTVFCPNAGDLAQITVFSFVDSVKGVGSIAHLKEAAVMSSKSDLETASPSTQAKYNYGWGDFQISLVNGQYIHNEGFSGEGMLIAVLDAGWNGFDNIDYFSHLFETGQLVGVRDLDPFNDNVFSGHQHGCNVTAVMAMNSPGLFVGTAPEASYFFIRSEVNWTEQHFEEDLMVTGFELADSIGADVINASLGYTDFPDYYYQRWTPQQSDGRTSVSSQAASLLAGKGIILVNAAGNKGEAEWTYIARPADATDILTVGALFTDSTRASFSSFGYSADGRVKPDVCALGVYVSSISEDGYVDFYNGTSLASPIMAGLTACLWQGMPDKTPLELMALIRESCHLYHNPNSELGYGIPNFNLFPASITTFENSAIRYTNPVTSLLIIENPDLTIQHIEIYDIQGKMIYTGETSNTQLTIDTSNWKAGIYIGFAAMKAHKMGRMKVVKK